MLLAGLGALTLVVLAIVFLGGMHRSELVRYGPVGAAELRTEFDFVPHFSVTYFASKHDQTLIPFILYTHERRDGASYVTIQTEHENDPYYRYDTLSHLEITNLTVTTKEVEKSLITEGNPARIYLNTDRWTSRSKKLGRCEGDEVEIETTGIAYTVDGLTYDFWYKQTWKKVMSSRWDIGFGLMP